MPNNNDTLTGYTVLQYGNDDGSGYYIGDKLILTAGHVLYRIDANIDPLKRKVVAKQNGKQSDLDLRLYQSRTLDKLVALQRPVHLANDGHDANSHTIGASYSDGEYLTYQRLNFPALPEVVINDTIFVNGSRGDIKKMMLV